VPALPVPGAPSPAFELVNQHGENVRSADLLGAPALLVFFPMVLTPECEGDLAALAALQADFEAFGARVVGLSVDHRYSLREAADRLGVDFDLLSDFWPHGEVARAFGAFDEARGHATRKTFVLDGGGRVVSIVASDRLTSRDPEEYLAVLSTAASSS
jgi:peroxiredoxin